MTIDRPAGAMSKMCRLVRDPKSADWGLPVQVSKPDRLMEFRWDGGIMVHLHGRDDDGKTSRLGG